MYLKGFCSSLVIWKGGQNTESWKLREKPVKEDDLVETYETLGSLNVTCWCAQGVESMIQVATTDC